MTTTQIPAVGSTVQFRPETPQYAKNQGISYVVTASPSGAPHSEDHEGRPYVWLVAAEDVTKAPSRQRTRTGWATALEVVR